MTSEYQPIQEDPTAAARYLEEQFEAEQAQQQAKARIPGLAFALALRAGLLEQVDTEPTQPAPIPRTD